MLRKFGKLSLLMPIGLFVMVATTIVSHYIIMTDFMEGIAYGAGIGLVLLPLVIKPAKAVGLAE